MVWGAYIGTAKKLNNFMGTDLERTHAVQGQSAKISPIEAAGFDQGPEELP